MDKRENLPKTSEELEREIKELRIAQAQLIQSEKLTSIGRLAAGIAHEINNPAGFVMNNLEVMKEYAEELSQNEGAVLDHQQRAILLEFPKIIEESYAGMQRIQKIVADLKTFSYSHDGLDKDGADINQLIDQAVNGAIKEINHNVPVTKEYGEIPPVICYPQLMKQVFLNIIINAAEAIADKGEVKIKTCLLQDDVCIEITDTGCGMSRDVCKHIFDPFFTTKPVGKGTGLGLSLVYNIIMQHGGTIDVKSKIGGGSTFTLRIPQVS